MNAIKRFFARALQRAMHAAIPVMPYREPKLITEPGGVVELLKEKGIGGVMLVTDRVIRGLGLTAPLERMIADGGIVCTIYDGTMPNPTSDNVEEATALYLKKECQALIAFGGGSAIDCAKAVGARIARPKTPLSGMQGLLKIRRSIPLLIAIPTTAGTGSETTLAAVIVDSKTHRKYVINDFCLIPKYALLDPAVTLGLPPHITATTGMDALTHAVEAYIGGARTKDTKASAERATELIFSNLERAYEHGDDVEARANMLHAAYLAGTAFTKSYVGYVHAVAHTLGGRYGIAHGLANAVLLPKLLRAYGTSATKRLAELARAVHLAPTDTPDGDAAEIIIAHIEKMNARMGIPESFPALRKTDIPDMAKLADREANPLYPVPVLWNSKELEQIYHLVYSGEEDNKARTAAEIPPLHQKQAENHARRHKISAPRRDRPRLNKHSECPR